MEDTLVDTSILLEPFVPWKNNEPNYKQSSLALIQGKLYSFNEKYTSITSIGVIGETGLLINEKITLIKEIEKNRKIAEETISNFFGKCKRVGLTKETIQLCNEILSMDSRINPLDALHIATAISEKCRNFLFIDYELARSSVLNKFAKDHGLNLVDFAIPKNKDNRRPKKDFITQG